MSEATEGYQLFKQLDQLFENDKDVPLADFYLQHIKDIDKHDIFPTEVIDSVFAVICTDEIHNHLKVTKKSYERAKKLFKFNSKSVGVTNKMLSDIYNNDSYHSIAKNFLGFISEDIARKIIRPNQWLVRSDDEAFIIVLCLREAPDAPIVYENYRVTYNAEDPDPCYVMEYKGETIRGGDWEQIVEKMNTLATAPEESPFYKSFENSRIYNWREGEDDVIQLWIATAEGQYNDYQHCLRWYSNVMALPDRKAFFNQALAQCFGSHFPHNAVEIIDYCVANGADINDPEQHGIYNFARYCGNEQWSSVANKIWSIGGDPNAIYQDGVPAFFVAAQRKDRAELFMRNPKLDINIKDKAGLNVAWHCKEKVDLAVFNDKRLDFHVIVDNKSLLDHAIEVYSIPYILKLISAGIDVQRPSVTKLGTYLHAFLTRAKQNKDDEIISVVRAMVEAGIDVQAQNSLYQTPLHIAAALLSATVVRALIVEHKANPNGHQESDSTPLHVAAERADINIINMLLELGANPKLKNARGQIPRDVAVFAAKAIFSKDEALPEYKFKAVKIAVTNPRHPQLNTNIAVIGDYLYTSLGKYSYYDWWDDYGYVYEQLFEKHLQKFERLPIGDIFDQSKKRTWEDIESTPERFVEYNHVDTFLKVNDQLWFNGKQNYVIFDAETKKYTQGPRKNRMYNHSQEPHFNYCENKLIHFAYMNELRITDKTTGALTTVAIDTGDYVKADHEYRHGALQDHILWFVVYRAPKILYALDLELRRIFKVFEFDFDLNSSLVCFGNRFLISTIVLNNIDHKLFILDLQTMRHSLHDFDLDVVPERDFNVNEDTHIEAVVPKGLEGKYEEAREKLKQSLAQKKYLFGYSSLVIYQSTLLVYGGRHHHGFLSTSYLFAIDLSQLLPYLSLEQHAALAVLKNPKKIDRKKLKQVPEDLRNKTNLW